MGVLPGESWMDLYCVKLASLNVMWRSVEVSVIQLCLTLWDPVDCSLSDSSVHGILQARIPEWVVTACDPTIIFK